MSLLKPRPDKDDGRELRRMALLGAVPGIILTAPLAGFGLGWWLDSRFGTEPLLQILGLALGLATAVRETYIIIKKASSYGEDDDGSDARI